MSGVRPVWLDEDDAVALRYIVNGSGGGADLIPWALGMLGRWDAAPADAVAAASFALGGHARFTEAAALAVLEALGYPHTEERP